MNIINKNNNTITTAPDVNSAESSAAGGHNLIMENRSTLTLSGVTEVESFDDRCVALYTRLGELIIRGRELHISAISLETGDMAVSGEIWSLNYGDKNRKNSSSLLGKLFR